MYIDLTMPLNPQTPVYPGDPNVEISEAANFNRDGYLDHLIKLGTHNGTHIDAPAHMIEKGKMLKDYSVDSFVGNGVVIEAENKFSLESLNVRKGDIVLFRTGKSDNYLTSDYYTKYSAVPEEIARQLVNLKVKMVGVDMGSIDHEPFPTHKHLLGNGILIIENLVNLDKLVGKSFKIYAFPLNVSVEGSPARVVAELI
jgi:arylformamidase